MQDSREVLTMVSPENSNFVDRGRNQTIFQSSKFNRTSKDVRKFDLKESFRQLSTLKQRVLVDSFCDLIAVDAYVEDCKIDLALCEDFNLENFC